YFCARSGIYYGSTPFD
nr:immunoglobulin heavy chain junction region [Mus musculus]